MGRPAVFLDLNGTLVMPVQVTSPLDYQPIAGCIDAVRCLNQKGFVCPVVTVQSRIEKGVYSEHAFRRWFTMLQQQCKAQGAELLGPYLCPHGFKTGCVCHKPQPTLYWRAAHDLDIDITASYVVVDTAEDIHAGVAIGARSCLVLTGWGAKAVTKVGHEASYVGANILAVAEWISNGVQKAS